MEFAVTSEQAGNAWTVRVSGEVDMATAPGLETELQTILAAGADRVEVDLAAVTFLDSSGIRALLVGRRRLSESEGTLTVSGMSEPVQRVLEIAGVLETLAPDSA